MKRLITIKIFLFILTSSILVGQSKLQNKVDNLKNITDKKKGFDLWYRQKYFQAWKSFARSFSDGQLNLNGPDEWQSMASKMTTPQNPYFELIERMSKELKPFANHEIQKNINRQNFA